MEIDSAKMSVVESGCLEGIANGCDNFPDFLNILDFPEESLEGEDFVGDWDANMLESLGPIPSDALMGLSPPLPKADIVNGSLKTAFKSQAIEESSGATLFYPSKYYDARKSRLFQTQSPISVLECSISNKPDLIIPVRTRSKRTRPTVNPWTLIPPPISPTASALGGKKRRMRMKTSVNNGVTSDQALSTVKRCTHCEVTKTPQWREGPLGPRTLCNACGVRYARDGFFRIPSSS